MPDLLPPQDKVLTFGENTYLALESVNNFPTDAVTIYCWVAWITPDYQDPEFASGAAPLPDTATLMNYNEKETDSYYRLWIANLKDITVWWSGGSTGGTGIDVSNGDWFHVAVTMRPIDDTHYRIQVIRNAGETDQLLVERTVSHDSGVTLQRQGGPLVLGQRFWGGDFEFSGQLAGFAVWDHVRSVEQIASDKNRILQNGENGLVINWVLNAPPPNVSAGGLKFDDVGGDDFGFDF